MWRFGEASVMNQPEGLPDRSVGSSLADFTARILKDFLVVSHPVRIAVEQERPEAAKLLRAANQLHRKAKRQSAARWALVLMLALLSLVAATHPDSAGAIAAVGLAGSLLVTLFLNPHIDSVNRDAAMIQEMFDTQVFGLRWPAAKHGQEITEERIASLARAYTDPYAEPGKPRAWYPPDSDNLPWPLNALVCQRANLSWDIGQRRRWSSLLMVGAFGWTAAGLVVAVAQSWSLVTLVVTWLAPSLAAVTLAF